MSARAEMRRKRRSSPRLSAVFRRLPLKTKMEPGGIEPPSRGSQQDASTRVSDDLLSDPGAAVSSISRSPARGVFSSVRPKASRTNQPDVFRRRPIGRRSPSAQPVLGRESVGTLSNHFFVCFLRSQHTLRRATSSLPCPVESSSAPICQRTRNSMRAGCAADSGSPAHHRTRSDAPAQRVLGLTRPHARTPIRVPHASMLRPSSSRCTAPSPRIRRQAAAAGRARSRSVPF